MKFVALLFLLCFFSQCYTKKSQQENLLELETSFAKRALDAARDISKAVETMQNYFFDGKLDGIYSFPTIHSDYEQQHLKPDQKFNKRSSQEVKLVERQGTTTYSQIVNEQCSSVGVVRQSVEEIVKTSFSLTSNNQRTHVEENIAM